MCRVRVFAEDAGHVGEIVAAALGVGGSHLRLAVLCHVGYIVRRRAALSKELDDLLRGRQGFVPFPVVEAGVVDEISVSVCIPGIVRIHRIMLLHAAKGKLNPFFRRVVVLLQELQVAVHQIHLIWDPHGGIAPAHAVLTDIAVPSGPGQGHGRILCLHKGQFLRIVDAGGGGKRYSHLAGGVLLDALIHQPFLEKLPYVHEIRRRAAVDHGVAGPGVALPGGAVHRNVQEVALLAPAGVFHQLVDELVGAAEITRFLHIGVDGDGIKVRILRENTLYKGVPEAKDGKVRGVLLHHGAFADVGDLLELRPSAVAVGGGEAAVLVQPFPVLEIHGLPGYGIPKRHSDIPRDVLSEVDDEMPRGVSQGPAGKALLFSHGDALVFDQLALGMFGAEGGFLPVMGLHAGVIGFALLQIRQHKGPEPDLPIFIRKHSFFAAIVVKKPQLAPERQLVAKVVVPAPPAVAHRNAQLVIAILDKGGHVVFLYLNPVVIAGESRRELVFSHRSPVEFRRIDPMGRETKDSSFQPRLSVKAAAENRYQSCFPVVCGVTNPSAIPIPEAVSHFLISRWYSVAFRKRLVPYA